MPPRLAPGSDPTRAMRPGIASYPAIWGSAEVLPYTDPLLIGDPGAKILGDRPLYADPRVYSVEALAVPAVADPWAAVQAQIFAHEWEVDVAPGGGRAAEIAAAAAAMVIDRLSLGSHGRPGSWQQALAHWSSAVLTGYAPVLIRWGDRDATGSPIVYRGRRVRVPVELVPWDAYTVRHDYRDPSAMIWHNGVEPLTLRWDTDQARRGWSVATWGTDPLPYGRSLLGAAGWSLANLAGHVDRGLSRIARRWLGTIEVDATGVGAMIRKGEYEALQSEVIQTIASLEQEGALLQTTAYKSAIAKAAAEAKTVGDLRRIAADALRLLIQGEILTSEASSAQGHGALSAGLAHAATGLRRAHAYATSTLVPAAQHLVAVALEAMIPGGVAAEDMPRIASALTLRAKQSLIEAGVAWGGEVDIAAYSDRAGLAGLLRPRRTKALAAQGSALPAGAGGGLEAGGAEADQGIDAEERARAVSPGRHAPLWEHLARAAGDPDLPPGVLARWRDWQARRDRDARAAALTVYPALQRHARAMIAAAGPGMTDPRRLATEPALLATRRAVSREIAGAGADIHRGTWRHWGEILGQDPAAREAEMVRLLRTLPLDPSILRQETGEDDEDELGLLLLAAGLARIEETVITCYEVPAYRDLALGAEEDRIRERYGADGSYDTAPDARRILAGEILAGMSRSAWHELRRAIDPEAWPYVAYLSTPGGRLPGLAGMVYAPWSQVGLLLRPPHGWGSTAAEIPVSAEEAEAAGYRGDVPLGGDRVSAVLEEIRQLQRQEAFPWWLFAAGLAILAYPDAVVGC